MRITFSILFIFVIKLSGLSQSTEFFKTYNLGSNSYPLLDNIIEINNNLYVNGVIRSPNQKILLLKANHIGNLTDTNIIGADTGNFYTGTFVQQSNNRILIPGAYENTTTYIYRPYLLFIDTNIIKLSDSVYTNKFTSFEGNVKINQSYYFVGNTMYNNNGDSLPTLNILFWKTDSNFNKITSNSIGLYNITEGYGCISAGFDNNLLLGGLTFVNGNQQDWYLVNVDTNGQILGEYYYGSPTRTDYDGIKSISLGSDSSYFLAGIFNKFYDTQSTYYYLAPQVVKLDRQFNTVWSKQFGSTIPGLILTKIVSTTDDNQAILTQRVPLGLYNTLYSQVTKFNNNGDILWSRNFYQGDTTQYIRYRAWDMIETNDKGFALCGSAIDTANVGLYQEAWLVKTDSLGCDGLRSCNDTALVCEILQAPDTACKNDTAWLQVRVKGRSAPYNIYANTTLALDSVYYPYFLPLWIDTLIPYYPITTGMQSVIVSVHDPWGWNRSDTVQVFVKNCGTGNIAETWYPKKVEIYPNPATNELHVKIRTTITTSVTITIYDLQGKPVKQFITNQNDNIIYISDLQQGVYGVSLIGNNINHNDKFVKL